MLRMTAEPTTEQPVRGAGHEGEQEEGGRQQHDRPAEAVPRWKDVVAGDPDERPDDRAKEQHRDEAVDQQPRRGGGVTSIASTRMIPTAWMLTTIVTVRSTSSSASSAKTG